jgi:hypothetical protein
MNYQPKHARRPDPAELPPALRGVADLLTIVSEKGDES